MILTLGGGLRINSDYLKFVNVYRDLKNKDASQIPCLRPKTRALEPRGQQQPRRNHAGCTDDERPTEWRRRNRDESTPSMLQEPDDTVVHNEIYPPTRSPAAKNRQAPASNNPTYVSTGRPQRAPKMGGCPARREAAPDTDFLIYTAHPFDVDKVALAVYS